MQTLQTYDRNKFKSNRVCHCSICLYSESNTLNDLNLSTILYYKHLLIVRQIHGNKKECPKAFLPQDPHTRPLPQILQIHQPDPAQS